MADDPRAKSQAVWDDMAPGWERYRDYMTKLSGHVTAWLVDNVQAREGDTILDLAGGAGDNGIAVAERVGSGRVIETDFAPRMVEVAGRRVRELGLSNIETRVLDAEKMDLPDDSVDGIICRWGFMLMIDPHAAMKECRRVLKHGRRMALSVWGGPEQNPWVTVPGMTLIQLGHQPGGDPFGPGGMFSLSDHDKLRESLEGAGFEEVKIEEMSVDWSYGSFDEAWSFWTQLAGAIAALVKQLPDAEVEKLRAALEEAVEPFRTDSGITIPGVTINASAS